MMQGMIGNDYEKFMKKLKYQKGITLTEMLITSALLVIVLPIAFLLINFVQANYSSANTGDKILNDVNTAIEMIEKDIRSASRPNGLTQSVVVHEGTSLLSKGQSMDIYYYDPDSNKYYRIGYRLLPSDKSKLQRGWVACGSEVPGSNAQNPIYGEIVDDPQDYESGEKGKWKTILDGIRYESNGSDIEIFRDITENPGMDRRKIKINLVVKNTGKLLTNTVKSTDNPVTVEKVITSRTKGIPYPDNE